MGEATIDARPKRPMSIPKALPIAGAIGLAAAAGIGVGSRLGHHEAQVPTSSSSSGSDNGHPAVLLETTTMPSEQALAENAVLSPVFRYESPTLGYETNIPYSWVVENYTNGAQSTDIFRGDVFGNIRTTVSITKKPVAMDEQTGRYLTLEEYIELARDDILLHNGHVLPPTSEEVAGHEAMKLRAIMPVNSDKNQMLIQVYFFTEDNAQTHVWIATATFTQHPIGYQEGQKFSHILDGFKVTS